MKKIDILKKIIQSGITTVTCAFLFTTVAGADSLSVVKITDDTAIPMELNALVMEVNTAQSYIVIAEDRFEVRPFSIDDNKARKTGLFDAGGNPVKLDFFKEGQRVFVEGFEVLEGDRYVARNIRLISQTDIRSDYRKIEKLEEVKSKK